jgi:hypothetical protein
MPTKSSLELAESINRFTSWYRNDDGSYYELAVDGRVAARCCLVSTDPITWKYGKDPNKTTSTLDAARVFAYREYLQDTYRQIRELLGAASKAAGIDVRDSNSNSNHLLIWYPSARYTQRIELHYGQWGSVGSVRTVPYPEDYVRGCFKNKYSYRLYPRVMWRSTRALDQARYVLRAADTLDEAKSALEISVLTQTVEDLLELTGFAEALQRGAADN